MRKIFWGKVLVATQRDVRLGGLNLPVDRLGELDFRRFSRNEFRKSRRAWSAEPKWLLGVL